jgi:hypothetical protein
MYAMRGDGPDCRIKGTEGESRPLNVSSAMRVRRRDARFWDEDEAKRADWEHRGRAL